jgi:hypothetical protein
MLLRKWWGVGLVLSLAVSAFLILGCAKAPEKELQEASAAIEAARTAEADLYVPDLFAEAQANLTEAETLSVAKKFKEAKDLALQAKTKADSAAAVAATNKEAKKAEVEGLLANAQKMLDELNKSIAGEKKIGKAKMTPVKNNAKAAEDLLAQAKKSHEGGDYRNAYDQAQMVMRKISDTQNEYAALKAPKALAPKVKAGKKK